MAWTQTDLDRLDAAIAKGVKSVTYQSGSVTYQSLAEMLQIRDMMRDELGLNAAKVTRSVGAYDNGLARGGFIDGCGWRRW
jgi:hypothetical protein